MPALKLKSVDTNLHHSLTVPRWPLPNSARSPGLQPHTTDERLFLQAGLLIDPHLNRAIQPMLIPHQTGPLELLMFGLVEPLTVTAPLHHYCCQWWYHLTAVRGLWSPVPHWLWSRAC